MCLEESLPHTRRRAGANGQSGVGSSRKLCTAVGRVRLPRLRNGLMQSGGGWLGGGGVHDGRRPTRVAAVEDHQTHRLRGLPDGAHVVVLTRVPESFGGLLRMTSPSRSGGKILLHHCLSALFHPFHTPSIPHIPSSEWFPDKCATPPMSNHLVIMYY